MSIQDDIDRIANEYCHTSSGLPAYIAAGLERDYYLVKLADLPEVTRGPSWSDCIEKTVVDFADGSRRAYGEGCAADLKADGLAKIAAALAWESRESEAAARQARRDELVHQYGYELTYADQSPMVKDLINRLISADADHTVAGEAEAARLKGEGR